MARKLKIGKPTK